MSGSIPILRQLMTTIEQRRDSPTPKSYTSQLISGGVASIGAKICEEAEEVVEAARGGTSAEQLSELIHEAADLLYHLLVMLAYRGVALEDVEAKLQSRFGVSGLEEKAARSGPRKDAGKETPPLSEGGAGGGSNSALTPPAPP